MFPVTIVDYDETWPQLYRDEKLHLQSVLGQELALSMEHFGSTAVPGLAAKPTIDILLETPSDRDDEIIRRMTKSGYQFIRREDCPPPYMMFVKGYNPEGFVGQCVHIHAAPRSHLGLWDRLYFRDYLRSNSEVAKEYEKLKQALAERYRFHREKYTDAKAEFVRRVTELGCSLGD